MWTSIKAFLSNPIKFVSDPANAVIEYQTQQLIKEGKSKEEITTILQTEMGLIKGGGALRQVYEGVTKTLEFVNKNFMTILIIMLIAIAGYYFLSLRRLAR